MDSVIRFVLNGRPVSVPGDPERSLLWVLRTDFNLTGSKYGCGEGYCGACTVLLNDRAVPSCQVSMKEVDGGRVTTIEGLSDGESLHPVQAAFIQHDALQCGYCTPGMVLQSVDLLQQNKTPSREQIISALEGHLCRCGSHERIVQAIHSAAETMAKGGRHE